MYIFIYANRRPSHTPKSRCDDISIIVRCGCDEQSQLYYFVDDNKYINELNISDLATNKSHLGNQPIDTDDMHTIRTYTSFSSISIFVCRILYVHIYIVKRCESLVFLFELD